MNKYKGNSKLLLLPKSTEEVSSILNYCNTERLAVVPQGRNTGLVRGCVPCYDEIIVSSKLMNKIIKLDESSSILTCESGCILQNLDDYLSKYDLMMPLDLGKKLKLLFHLS
jgi:D-2-hydroxyglutarate dehydrogenase